MKADHGIQAVKFRSILLKELSECISYRSDFVEKQVIARTADGFNIHRDSVSGTVPESRLEG